METYQQLVDSKLPDTDPDLLADPTCNGSRKDSLKCRALNLILDPIFSRLTADNVLLCTSIKRPTVPQSVAIEVLHIQTGNANFLSFRTNLRVPKNRGYRELIVATRHSCNFRRQRAACNPYSIVSEDTFCMREGSEHIHEAEAGQQLFWTTIDCSKPSRTRRHMTNFLKAI